jgi:integrase/ribosomal protein S27AE
MTSAEYRPHCLRCGSEKVWRNGHSNGSQRYLCGSCGYEFTSLQVKRHVVRKSFKGLNPESNPSETSNRLAVQDRPNGPPLLLSEDVCPQFSSNVSIVGKGLSRLRPYTRDAQVGALNGGVKNLASSREIQKTVASAEDATLVDANGKIVEFAWWLLKQGYAESTVESRTKLLKLLVKRNANLYDPETVKDVIAKQRWCPGRKENAVHAYSSFLKMAGGKWEPPRYQRIGKLPWVPTESEIDQLIAGCSHRLATFLQLLKETGMRPGEAWSLKWTDMDFNNDSVRVTPEKGSNPRILKLSDKLVAMLKSLSQKNECVFRSGLLKHFTGGFRQQRIRIATKLKNTRINMITLKTFRHFKGTMEYHKTKDILHVMEVLGHKNIKNTLVYTHLVNFKNDEFTSKVAKTADEASKLVEAGFEYVCTTPENFMLFKMRK